MSRVLIIADHDGNQLGSGTSRCVTAAAKLGAAEVHVAVLAASGGAIAAQAAELAGVSKVLVVERAENAHLLAAVLAPQVVKLAAGYEYVLAPANTFGKDLLPRVAALLGVGQVSDLMFVESAHRFRRPTYAGNAIVTIESPPEVKLVATVRTASFAAAGGGGSAPVEGVSTDAVLPTHTRFVSINAAKTDRPELQSASRVVSGGRATISILSTRWPTGWALRSAPRAPRWMPATCRATCRLGRPERLSPRSCTWRSASRVRSSTSPGSRMRVQ